MPYPPQYYPRRSDITAATDAYECLIRLTDRTTSPPERPGYVLPEPKKSKPDKRAERAVWRAEAKLRGHK